MRTLTQPDTMPTTATAIQMIDNVTKAQNAALTFLCLTIDQAIAVFSAQPKRYSTIMKDFRSLDFDNSHTVSCTLEGWKLNPVWNLYIIPQLRGFVTPVGTAGGGQFIPFERFLPTSAEHGVGYVELLAEINGLIGLGTGIDN